jgi:hypothetical protein
MRDSVRAILLKTKLFFLKPGRGTVHVFSEHPSPIEQISLQSQTEELPPSRKKSFSCRTQRFGELQPPENSHLERSRYVTRTSHSLSAGDHSGSVSARPTSGVKSWLPRPFVGEVSNGEDKVAA